MSDQTVSKRRILSLWFPRLGADRTLRQMPQLAGSALAIVDTIGNAQVISSLSVEASALGLYVGQPVRDAHAMAEALVTRNRSAQVEARFLDVLQRWAGKFSPWVAKEGEAGLVVDLTGCAHLFGGEAPLMQVVQEDCTDMRLAVQMGLADTRGAAWALARYAGQAAHTVRSGDAIDQEARATRSRAGKRHWTKGGAAPTAKLAGSGPGLRIAQPGQTYAALADLPIPALRLEPEMAAQLARLGLRRVSDLIGQPRAALARRFGKGLVYRIDQALGSAPEPVSPAKPPDHFAVRLTLPEPIGLIEDIVAGIDRLLSPLCAKLDAKNRAIRRIRLDAYRSDHGVQSVEIALARPSTDPHRIRPLLEMKLDTIDAGFGIDMLRLDAIQVEPIYQARAVGHLEAGQAVADRIAKTDALDDLIGKIGARVGMEAITRLHPASSHIPEKTSKILAAAWSEPPGENWPQATGPRPLLMWAPEIVLAPDLPHVPAEFKWRGRSHRLVRATGPERIAPEWWLDDPQWRTGTRDYWRVTVDSGEDLWLYFAYGAGLSPGWFCHGAFA
ncbi:MAG: DNA polymerase Y family protein [Pseudomonadota bacterium]